MKKVSKTASVVKEVASDATVIEATNVIITPGVTVTEAPRLGRPIKPDSARQQKLAKMAVYDGPPRLGRPTVEGSKRQVQLAEIKAKKAAGIVGKKGRPVMTEEQKIEAREKRQAAYEAWLENHKQKEALRDVAVLETSGAE